MFTQICSHGCTHTISTLDRKVLVELTHGPANTTTGNEWLISACEDPNWYGLPIIPASVSSTSKKEEPLPGIRYTHSCVVNGFFGGRDESATWDGIYLSTVKPNGAFQICLKKQGVRKGMRGECPIDGEGASCISILAAFTIDLLRFEVNFSCLLLGFQQKRQHFGVTVDFGFGIKYFQALKLYRPFLGSRGSTWAAVTGKNAKPLLLSLLFFSCGYFSDNKIEPYFALDFRYR